MIITAGEKFGDFFERSKRFIEISINNMEELRYAVYYVLDNALRQRITMVDPLWYTYVYAGQRCLVVEYEMGYA